MPVILKANQGEQDALLKISPVTAKGKPAEIEAGTLAVVVSSGDGVVEVQADGKSALVTTGAIGVTTGTISGDADLGAGVETITDTFEITVVAVLAAQLGATGELVDKA